MDQNGSQKTLMGAPDLQQKPILFRKGSFWRSLARFGSLLAPFWMLSAPFWLHLGCFWLHFGSKIAFFGTRVRDIMLFGTQVRESPADCRWHLRRRKFLACTLPFLGPERAYCHRQLRSSLLAPFPF